MSVSITPSIPPSLPPSLPQHSLSIQHPLTPSLPSFIPPPPSSLQYAVGDAIYFEQSKGKGYMYYANGVIKRVLDNNVYEVVDEDDIIHTLHVKSLMRKEDYDSKSMRRMPTSGSGVINLYREMSQSLLPRRRRFEDRSPHSPMKKKKRRCDQERGVDEKNSSITKENIQLRAEIKRLKNELDGGIPGDFESYGEHDTKWRANEKFCSAIKSLMIDLTGKESGHNGMISYLESSSMNTTNHLVQSDVIGDSPISMINRHGRKSELIARFASKILGDDIPYSVHTMYSDDFIRWNTCIHKALWLDFENTFKQDVLFTDIQHVFKNRMFSLGGILGLTFSVRNDYGRHKTIHEEVNRMANNNGYKIRCLDANGIAYDVIDVINGVHGDKVDKTFGYKPAMKLILYEVRPM